MLLESNKMILLRRLSGENCCWARVLEVEDDYCRLDLTEEQCLELMHYAGSIRVEMVCPERNLYFFHATLTRIVKTDGIKYILSNLSEPQRLERRTAPRITVKMAAGYIVLPEAEPQETLHKGRILNLSMSGALIAAQAPLQVNDEVLLLFDIKLERKKVPVGLVANVVREHQPLCEETGHGWKHGYGIRFKNFPRTLWNNDRTINNREYSYA